VKTLPLLFSFLCTLGCGTDDPAPQVVEPEPIDQQPEPVPEPEPVIDPLDEAMGLLERGQLGEATGAIEALLGEQPENDELWYALELCALGSGQPAELLDRLSVTEAIGGRDLPHHSLRATLALAAERPADAVDAALALRGKDDALSATFLAMALQAGGNVPKKDLDPESPNDALLLAVSESNPRKLEPLLTTAKQVEGWRAALLRAQTILALEDDERLPEVLAELEAAASSDDPRAKLAAAAMRVELVEEPAEQLEIVLAAAESAMAVHNTIEGTRLRARAVDLQLQLGLADEAHELAKAHLEALPDGNSPLRDQASIFTVNAALAAGEVAESISLIDAALAAEEPPAASAELAAALTRAAWRSCDTKALASAAESLPESAAPAAQGMSALCSGDLTTARDKLAAAEVDGPLAVDTQLALAWAWFGEAEAIAAAQGAFTAAEQLGWAATRLEAGLALERHARVNRDLTKAGAAIAALEVDAPPALQAELHVRRRAQGMDPGPLPTIEDEPALVTAWRGFTTPATPGETPSTGIVAWAEAHQALKAGGAGEAKEALNRAFPHIPVRRQGRWSPPLALDGADGPTLDADASAAIGLTGRGGEDALLALHEFSHYRDFQRLAASVGYDWTIGLDEQARSAFAQAYSREHARSLLWLLGTAPFPSEAREATLTSVPELDCLGGMSAPLDVAGVRTGYAETALFSIRLGAETGELLLVTPSTTRVTPFEKPEKIRGWVQDYLDALGRGRAFGGSATDPRAGDAFRRAVIDGVVGDLVGIARYLVVADPEIMRLPWAVLPEQVEGRRYLADIRTVSSLPYLGGGDSTATAPEGGYKPDFLGISREEMVALEEMSTDELAVTDEVTRTMLEAGLKPQGETNSIARLFGGGYSVVKQGAEATQEAFLGTLAEGKQPGEEQNGFRTARYLHLAGIPAGPAGGFEWTDGHTLLPQLACEDISAKLVVVSTGPSPEVQLVRAQALRDAGATGVLVAMWNPPPILRSRYLTSVYDALNRERAPARALAEARETLVNTLGADGGQADPSYWGAFLYVGAP
jgi:hypothetical protein